MLRIVVLAILLSAVPANAQMWSGDELGNLCRNNREAAVAYVAGAIHEQFQTRPCARLVNNEEFASRMCEMIDTDEHPWMYSGPAIITIVLADSAECQIR